MKDTTTVKQNGIAKFMKTMNPTEKIDTLICCGLMRSFAYQWALFLKRLQMFINPETFYLEMSGHWTKDYPRCI